MLGPREEWLEARIGRELVVEEWAVLGRAVGGGVLEEMGALSLRWMLDDVEDCEKAGRRAREMWEKVEGESVVLVAWVLAGLAGQEESCSEHGEVEVLSVLSMLPGSLLCL